MASRVTRQSSTLASSARSGLRAKNSFTPTRFVARRWNSSQGHGHGQQKSSDMPWVIGSGLIFGPAFLYLLSPSSRKAAPHAAHGHEDKSHKKVTMKDDEGTEADVTSAVKAAEADDIPKADGAKVDATETADAPAPEPEQTQEKEKDDESTPSQESSEPRGTEEKDTSSTQKAGTFQDESDSGPTNMGDARKAAREETPPKEAEEKSEKS